MRRGLVEGDRLALTIGASAELLSVALGALRIGIVPVMLDPGLTSAEREVLLADAAPALTVNDDAGLADLLHGDPVELADAPRARPMHYTSGTTGRRKGVWSGLLPDDEAAQLLVEERSLWGFNEADVHLVVSPLHHSAPLRFASSTLLAGGAVAVLPRFDARAVLEALDEVRPTTLFCAPAHLHRLFAAVDDGAAFPDVAQLRLLAHAGAPCPKNLKEQTVAALPEGAVWEFYGSTEGQFTACSTADWRAHPGSVGRARPGRRLEIADDGTIWCHVPRYAQFSYWRDQAKTDSAWRGSAFSVGDLGRLDAEGFLYLEGRRDDLIITGGVNVYPLEVELVLGEVPGVTVAVFGRSDERWGQRVCVAYTGKALELEHELRARAAERLSGAKRPKEYHRVESLPRTSTGKVRRSVLAAELGLEP
ncbi:MAG: AMP-dependent synthetase [Frankiales bacterium]|jgi:long-chain acyl-CoA synthetase|nr:AMP-dependent synthetase [Frankiales bacterium]